MKIEESPCAELPNPKVPLEPLKKTKPFGFTREKRLLSTVEFNAVFKKSDHRFRQEAFQLIARLQTKDHSRLGLVVPKKMLKKAVHRNRLKRLFRDQFRRLPGNYTYDVVVSLRQKVDPEALYSQDLVNTIRELFTRLDRYCSRKADK